MVEGHRVCSAWNAQEATHTAGCVEERGVATHQDTR